MTPDTYVCYEASYCRLVDANWVVRQCLLPTSQHSALGSMSEMGIVYTPKLHNVAVSCASNYVLDAIVPGLSTLCDHELASSVCWGR
jgi:hypothetical protein